MYKSVLLDQNIHYSIKNWLQQKLTDYIIYHTFDLGLQQAKDKEIWEWALQNEAAIVTFDEDFSNPLLFNQNPKPLVIRLKIEPTSPEVTQLALTRLLADFQLKDFNNELIIIEQSRIRMITKK